MVMPSESLVKPRWEVDAARCDGCGDCVVICPVQALTVKAKVAIMIDEESCCQESCRICERHCPQKAIKAY